jgi:hypothetical protein
LNVSPGQLLPFKARVTGLGPGSYTATLHVTSPDAAMVDQAVTMLVRAPAWVAGILFAVGVFGSMGLRWYYQTKRPAIVTERTASLLRAAIASAKPPDDEAVRALATIESRLSDVMTRFTFGEPSIQPPLSPRFKEG